MKARNRPRRKVSVPPRDLASVTCEAATDLIGDYLADHLDLHDRRAFEAHLSRCPDCAAFLITYKRTIGLTRSFLASQSLHGKPVELKFRVPPAAR
jgi:anti-sigma factor RsiW